ncbi:hypothetical protein SAMN05421869_11869 [Nonomuraea jiangxiensis]|uniref:Uncharacterized protein n=1 Tax=Nonomuraea jiangxiensis TaxID=633440 RepID=A0A1G9E816_9ACTN|nr:hypothetical protein SAMN05421869_11869 [Nonomuraea jiangxiensis]
MRRGGGSGIRGAQRAGRRARDTPHRSLPTQRHLAPQGLGGAPCTRHISRDCAADVGHAVPRRAGRRAWGHAACHAIGRRMWDTRCHAGLGGGPGDTPHPTRLGQWTWDAHPKGGSEPGTRHTGHWRRTDICRPTGLAAHPGHASYGGSRALSRRASHGWMASGHVTGRWDRSAAESRMPSLCVLASPRPWPLTPAGRRPAAARPPPGRRPAPARPPPGRRPAPARPPPGPRPAPARLRPRMPAGGPGSVSQARPSVRGSQPVRAVCGPVCAPCGPPVPPCDRRSHGWAFYGPSYGWLIPDVGLWAVLWSALVRRWGLCPVPSAVGPLWCRRLGARQEGR